jgi:hypothetical protein
MPILDYSKMDVFKWLHRFEKSLIYRYSGKASVRCHIDGKPIEFEVTDTGNFTVVIDNETLGVTDHTRFPKLFLGEDYSLAVEKKLSGYTAFIPNSDQFMANLSDKLVSHWDEVEATGAHMKIVKNFVTKVVEDRFTDTSVRFQEIVLRKELQDDVAYIRLNDVGGGVKRFLTAALWLEAIKPRVVLWDDLEASAHPSLIRSIVEWLMDHDWQVVASTHSIDVLREIVVAELDPREVKVIQLKKSPDDVISWKGLSIDEVRDLIDSGQDVRKLLAW